MQDHVSVVAPDGAVMIREKGISEHMRALDGSRKAHFVSVEDMQGKCMSATIDRCSVVDPPP